MENAEKKLLKKKRLTKLVELEGRSRLNKFCIDGLLETQNESCEACEDKVQYLIQCRTEGGDKLTDVIV